MIHLDPPIAALLDRLERFGADHDAHTAERAGRMLNLERPTAELLYMLMVASGRRRVLEIGTSNAYSTIWLALAMRRTGGAPVVSIERDAAKLALARANLSQAGVDHAVQLIEDDATAACHGLPGPFDCVFFDADRTSAPEQLAVLLPKLSEDAVLCADNALSHPQEIAAYLQAVETSGAFDTTLVPVGKGLHIARKRSGKTPR
jgi:predicted O-methyltransferase YrrM